MDGMFRKKNRNTFAAMRKRNEERRREELRKQAMSAKPKYTRADFSPPPRKDPPRNIDPNTGMRDRRSGVERAAAAAPALLRGVRAGLNQAASGAIEKASKINRAMFPSLGQIAAGSRPRTGGPADPTKGLDYDVMARGKSYRMPGDAGYGTSPISGRPIAPKPKPQSRRKPKSIRASLQIMRGQLRSGQRRLREQLDGLL